jgi:hypothetical protein
MNDLTAQVRNRERCAGPVWRPLGRLAFRVAPRVPILLCSRSESRANLSRVPSWVEIFAHRSP